MPKDLTVHDWSKRISAAEKVRDKERDRQGWMRFLEEYQGNYRTGLGSLNNLAQIGVPPINLVYGYVHSEIPKLYFRDPYSTVNPAKGNTIQRAKIMEPSLNYIKRELNLKYENFKVLLDALLIGHSWMKFGHSSEIEKAEDGQSEFIKNEEIFAVHVPWDEMLFDNYISKDPPYDSRWLDHSIIKPLDEARDAYNAPGLKSNISLSEDKRDQRGNIEEPPDIQLVKLHETYDRDRKKILVWAEGYDRYLDKRDNPYEMEGFNFTMLKFNKVPGKPYPLSDIFLIEPQILERIKIRASQINHIKRWNRQLSIEEGSMSKEELEKLALGIDGAITERKRGSMAPQPLQYATMQAEIFQLDSLIDRDMTDVIGQTSMDRGGEAKTETNTLGEAEMQQSSSSLRASKRQDTLEDFVEEGDRKIIQLLKQFQDVPRYVAITGKTPEQVIAELGPEVGARFDGQGLHFTKDDIQGEYDVDVKAGTSVPLNKNNRDKMLIKLLDLGPGIGIQPNGPVSREIGKELMRDMELKAVEKAYEEEEMAMKAPPPSPMPAPGLPPMPPPMPESLPPPPVGEMPMPGSLPL